MFYYILYNAIPCTVLHCVQVYTTYENFNRNILHTIFCAISYIVLYYLLYYTRLTDGKSTYICLDLSPMLPSITLAADELDKEPIVLSSSI